LKTFILQAIFWVSLVAVAYTYVLYILLLFVLASIRQVASDFVFLLARRSRRCSSQDESLPCVALLVAAYNEEDVIEAKLRNTAQLDYPSEKLEFVLGLDAPSDSTAERARTLLQPNFRILSFPVRRGKLAVVNDLIERTSSEVVVFSDANTMLKPDCIRKLVRHFADSQIGGVCGEVRLESSGGEVQMESLYWRYEMALKFLENRLNCVLGANGAVYAVRRSLYPRQGNWIVEDFQIPMEIRFAGHRIVYDPEAIGVEEAAPSFSVEFHRKVRIGAGDYQTLIRNPQFLNPFSGLPAFAYFSHKVLRWLVPFFLLAAWLSNLILATRPFYVVTFGAQSLFYLLALLGWFRFRAGRTPRILSPLLYFCGMNLALLFGLVQFLAGLQRGVWRRTPRAIPPAVRSG